MTFLRSTPANRCNSAPDSPCGRSSSKRERYLRISVAWGSSESASGDTSKWISSGLPEFVKEGAISTNIGSLGIKRIREWRYVQVDQFRVADNPLGICTRDCAQLQASLAVITRTPGECEYSRSPVPAHGVAG